MSNVKVDINELLEAGVHFGHNTSRWHPKMAPYIHSKKAGGHIIDLTQTVAALEAALPEVIKVVEQGKQVLFVGTKRQAKDIVKQAAEKVSMPYVTARWMGGTLTNYKTISVQVKKLKELEGKMASGELANRYSKLEVQRLQEQIDGLNMVYGGIKELQPHPGLVFSSDMVVDAIAISEANKLNIPVVAIVDTNVDPTSITYPIPGNDDAIKSIATITALVVAAVEQAQAKKTVAPKPTTGKTSKAKEKSDEG